jgi:hypothetical protein
MSGSRAIAVTRPIHLRGVRPISPLGSDSRALDLVHGLPLLPRRHQQRALRLLRSYAHEDSFVAAELRRALEQCGDDPVAIRESINGTYPGTVIARNKWFTRELESILKSQHRSCYQPLLHVGPVPVYQGTPHESVPYRLSPNETIGPYKFLSFRSYIHGNDQPRRFTAEAAGLGGTWFGIGSWHNIDLAITAADASGIILLDLDPCVSLTLALLLASVARHENRVEFIRYARGLMNMFQDPYVYLENVPQDYQDAFFNHIRWIRSSLTFFGKFHWMLWDATRNKSGSLGSDQAYAKLRDLVRAGRTPIIYGNLYSPEMPGILESVTETLENSVRAFYLSNALAWRTKPFGEWAAELSPFTAFMQHYLSQDWLDRDAQILMTTTNDLRHPLMLLQRYATLSPFMGRHSMKAKDAERLLGAYGNLYGFEHFFKAQTGINYPFC